MDDRTKPLVATPAARDQAIEKLQDHYAKNHLEVEDFEKLVERAEHARSNDELVKLFDGLPELEDVALVTTAPGRTTSTIGATLDPRRVEASGACPRASSSKRASAAWSSI